MRTAFHIIAPFILLAYGIPQTRFERAAKKLPSGENQMASGVTLKPVDVNFTLKDHIYDVLLEAILDTNIYDENADLRLDERKMAEQLQISRTPIREALARLEQNGLVEIKPRKGVYIQRKTRNEVMEMIVVWAALESMAARLATEVATDAELKSLRKLAERHAAIDPITDIESYSKANIRFHQRILELSSCDALKETADTLFMHMHGVRRRAIGEADRAARSVADHMAIVSALEARDAPLAENLVREHSMRLRRHISDTWVEIGTTQLNTAS